MIYDRVLLIRSHANLFNQQNDHFVWLFDKLSIDLSVIHSFLVSVTVK